MRLLIIRHADAGDAGEFALTGQPDDLRPLSDKGREQMRGVARALVQLVRSVDLIVTSPYTRAQQTAKIVRSAYGAGVPELTSDTLEPEKAPAEFTAWLREHSDKEVVAAVGHEPHLSTLATWLMTGSEDSSVNMKKAGACLLEFDKEAKRGAGVLRWLMGPKELREIG